MNTTTVTIRPFDASLDTEKLSHIWLSASIIAHAFIGEERLIEQQGLIESKYLPDAETWIACREGRPVGFISLIDNFIGGLFIDPAEQGRGTGRQLIEFALKQRPELALEVYLANHGAMAFYQALGFTELSRRSHDDEGAPFPNARLAIIA